MSAYDYSFNSLYQRLCGDSSTSVETKLPEFLLKKEKDAVYAQIGNKRRLINTQFTCFSVVLIFGRFFSQAIKDLPLGIASKISAVRELVAINICFSQKKHLKCQQNAAHSKAHFWTKLTQEKVKERLEKYDSQKTAIQDKLRVTHNTEATAKLLNEKLAAITKKIENWEKLNKNFSSLDQVALDSFQKAKAKRWETKHERLVDLQQLRKVDIKKHSIVCLTFVFSSALVSSGFGFIPIFSTACAARLVKDILFLSYQEDLEISIQNKETSLRENRPKVEDLLLSST